MGEEEKRLQADAGLQSQVGEVGYLRASIGMVAENRLLRRIFNDEELWEGRTKEFDFIAAKARLPDLLDAYVQGEELPETPDSRKQVEMGNAVQELLRQAGYSEEQVSMGESRDEMGRKRYAASIVRFFVVAMQKQHEGKHPKVYISW